MKSTKNKTSFIKRYIIITFISLVFVSGYLYTVILKSRISGKEDISNRDEKMLDSQEEDLVWEKYVNEDYGFSFDRPKLLSERELDNSGEYLLFIRFEENQYTNASGIGLGVRKYTLYTEVDGLKKELERDFEIKLLSETNERIDGFDAVILRYEPRDKNIFESRSFLVISNGEYSISISSVPNQMERVITSFKFL